MIAEVNEIADGRWMAGQPIELAQPQEPGQWERIAFMGHIEYTGRVTRFDRYGEPAYRIELPDLVFGGNPLAYREHRASMWFSSEPVSEESARAAWEARNQRPAIGSGGWPYDEDDDAEAEYARELAEEGNAVAMTAAEREEYDDLHGFALDAADEARDLERETDGVE